MDVITGREPEQLCKSRLAALTGRILAPDKPTSSNHAQVFFSFLLPSDRFSPARVLINIDGHDVQGSASPPPMAMYVLTCS